MASLRKIKTKTGEGWRIEIMVNGDRKNVYLGKTNKKAAETVCSRVETINSCNLAGLQYPADVAQWLGTIGDDLHEKLSKVSLVQQRKSTQLADFLDSYLIERSDLKPRTRQKNATSVKSLVQFFGNVPLRTITQELAAAYRVHLAKEKYSEATLSKMVGIARSFFNVAHRRKLVDENPFQYVEKGSQINKKRDYDVSQSEIDHLIDACTNAKDRLKIALAWYTGLRIPSELVGLRWSEVIWGTQETPGRFTVHSPKTERKGKGERIIPIFPELEPYLTEAFESAPEGGDKIFPEITDKKSLGSWIEKLAKRAGITLWEKPAQNIRRTCVNNMRKKYPAHVCNAWLGHTEQVADRHYLRVTEDYFRQATEILRTPDRANDTTSLESTEAVKKIAHFRAQHTPEIACR